jgi:hypothetical protein
LEQSYVNAISTELGTRSEKMPIGIDIQDLLTSKKATLLKYYPEELSNDT